jgi:hypothetical protein
LVEVKTGGGRVALVVSGSIGGVGISGIGFGIRRGQPLAFANLPG